MFVDTVFQLEEVKKSLEEELTDKKNALALQLASGGDQRPSKVCGPINLCDHSPGIKSASTKAIFFVCRNLI